VCWVDEFCVLLMGACACSGRCRILPKDMPRVWYASRGHAESSDLGTEGSLGVWFVSCHRIIRHEAILCRRTMWFHEKPSDESMLDHSMLHDLGLQTKHAIKFPIQLDKNPFHKLVRVPLLPTCLFANPCFSFTIFSLLFFPLPSLPFLQSSACSRFPLFPSFAFFIPAMNFLEATIIYGMSRTHEFYRNHAGIL